MSLLVLPSTIGAQNIGATRASSIKMLSMAGENSYQSQAWAASLGTLRNPSELHIRNYYALACIYYATNGMSNKITDLTLPDCPTLAVVRLYCTKFGGITCNNETNVLVQIELNENRLYGSKLAKPGGPSQESFGAH